MDADIQSDEVSAFEEYVNLMEKYMNPDVDPSEDFFEYANGRYNQLNHEEDPKELLRHVNFFYLPSLSLYRMLKNETIDCPLMRKVRDFFTSIETNPRMILQNEELREFCGGFPAFHDNWSEENFNWIRAAAILSAMRLNTIINICVRYLDDTKRITVNLEEPNRYVPENVEEVLTPLELSGEKISEIVNSVNLIREKFLSIPVTNPGAFEYLERTFEELRGEEFDYQLFFETALGHPLSNNDRFTLFNRGPGYLTAFLNIFAEAPPRVVANYITFKVAYITSFGFNPYELTIEHLTPPILAVGFARYWNRYEKYKRAEIFKRFTEDCREDIPATDFDYEHSYRNEDEQTLEFINSHLNYESVKKDYEDLQISPDNFFQNLINILRLPTPASVKVCFSYRSEQFDLYLTSADLLHFIISYYRKPMVYYFSGWNVDNWRGVIQMMEPPDVVNEFWTIGSSLQDQLEKFGFKDEEEDYSLFDTRYEYITSSVITSMEALKLSYKNYKIWLSKNETVARKQNEILSRLNLNNSKIFFISFAQQNYRNADRQEPLILALLNSEEFSETFNCKPDSKMNPRNKCKITWNEESESESK